MQGKAKLFLHRISFEILVKQNESGILPSHKPAVLTAGYKEDLISLF